MSFFLFFTLFTYKNISLINSAYKDILNIEQTYEIWLHF